MTCRVIKLEDNANYRRILSNLSDNVTQARKNFIDSLTFKQYREFNRQFRLNKLDLNINKISKNKKIISLFNSWKVETNRYNKVMGV